MELEIDYLVTVPNNAYTRAWTQCFPHCFDDEVVDGQFDPVFFKCFPVFHQGIHLTVDCTVSMSNSGLEINNELWLIGWFRSKDASTHLRLS